MTLSALTSTYLPAIEAELKSVVMTTCQPGVDELHTMLAYHLGWIGEGAGSEAGGKRIRPLLVALCTAAAGGDWQAALPAAASVELIHNFSLIHDDIQDRSPLRRGRPTLWTRWGDAQAINAGDTMFALGHLALLRLEETVSSHAALRAMRVLDETCIHLTQGQYLDLSYEQRGDLSVADYWPMVAGKTGALLSACTRFGALAAQTDEAVYAAYERFGRLVGLAFQALDDLLGIWGDAALTGKSTDSDLVSGKKSLPVLYGLGLGGDFSRRWLAGPIVADEVRALAAQLEVEGARSYALDQANRLTSEALQALDDARTTGVAGEALCELSNRLLQRAA